MTINGRRSLLGAAGRWLAAVKPDLIPALAHRDRPGFLGRGVRAHRVSRRSQLDRNIDRNSELLARFGGARVRVPALYIAGDCDLQGEEVGFAVDSPLEGDGFELVWGFFCQVAVLVIGGSLFGAGKPFFVPSPAIRFAERR